MGPADKMTVPLECPQCGQQHPRTLRQLQREPLIRCPCGASIEVAGETASMVRALDDLDRALKKFGK